jgi:hypothetical protein
MRRGVVKEDREIHEEGSGEGGRRYMRRGVVKEDRGIHERVTSPHQ